MINIIKIIRPLNVLLGGFAVAIALNIINYPWFDLKIIYIYSVVMFFIAGSNVLNDILDYSSDQVNHPTRPIPSGIISKKYSYLLSGMLFLFGIYSALHLNTFSKYFSLGLVFIISQVIFGFRDKDKPIPLE